MASWRYLSLDDSSSDSDNLPPMLHNNEMIGGMPTVRIKSEPMTFKSEPLSPPDFRCVHCGASTDQNNHPHSSPNTGDFPSVGSGDDEYRTMPQVNPQDSPMPTTNDHVNDNINFGELFDYNLDDFVPYAVAKADGLSIRHSRGLFFIPYEEVPQKVIFTGHPGSAATYFSNLEGWIHIPGGVKIDQRINHSLPTTTIVSLESFMGSVPPAIPIDSVPPAIPIDSVPPAIPFDNVPLAIPIDNVPVRIKSEIISDDEDEDNADNHYMYADFAANVQNDDAAAAAAADVQNYEATYVCDEVHTDIYMKALESKESLVLRNIESNEESVMDISKSNEEPFEEKCILPVISSSEHFQKEICQKDPSDPTFGVGFEIDRIMNPKLGDDDIFLFEVQWRNNNFSGIDELQAPIIYNHWPEVALKFYQERYKDTI